MRAPLPRRRRRALTTPVLALVVALLVSGCACGSDRQEAAGNEGAGSPGGTAVTDAGRGAACDRTAATGAGTTAVAIADVPPPPGAAAVRGRAVDGACGTGVGGLKVLLLDPTNQARAVGVTTTAPDGTWSFPRVAPGSYRLSLFDATAAYVTIFRPDAPDFDEGEPLALAAGVPATWDATVHRPADQPVPDYTGTGRGRRVSVIGDSLVQQSTAALRSKLEPLGPTSVRGISLQRTDEMLPVARRYAETHPEVVVIALGNNDLMARADTATVLARLRTMLDLFPDARCLAVVTVNSHTGQDDFNARATSLNAELRRLSTTDPRVTAVDWDEDVRLLISQLVAPSAWFTDTLHLTPLGAGAYATAMEGAVRRCP